MESNRVVVCAPAKVNLALDIVGLLENGYHLLASVMQTIDLCDELHICRQAENAVRLTCSLTDIPQDASNTACRAAAAFFAATGLKQQGLHIHIEKTIPVMAGLGGGSADAAGVLCGLNHMFATGLSLAQLSEIGLRVGADVPFCVQGGTAFVQGVGEVIAALPPLPACWLLLAKPAAGISTQRAFALYDEGRLDGGHAAPQAVQAVRCGNLPALGKSMANVFEQVAGVHELVSPLKAHMLRAGALGAVLSGSGSAVVGLYDRRAEAEQGMRRLQTLAHKVFLVQPRQQGAQVVYAE